MRRLTELDSFRSRRWEANLIAAMGGEPMPPDLGGCFIMSSPVDRGSLRIMAANDEGWDHVSVSRQDRIPNWMEMEFVKRHFFKDDETAFQLHVPPAAHVNVHSHCLHLWRPHHQPIPMPPVWMVG